MKDSVFKTKPVARIGARLIDRAESESIRARIIALRRASMRKRMADPEIINYLKKVRQNDRKEDCIY